MMLDKADFKIIALVVEKINKEKGRRLPIHSLHRWWSRRFAAIYRFILASYLTSKESIIRQALEKPSILRKYARGKVFVEPFAGGGTGLTEAVIAGWNVYGVDINPLATRISKASIKLVTHGFSKNYEQLAIKVLDKALEETRLFWIFEKKLVSYFFISTYRVPTWISTINTENQTYKVLMCPKCHNIFIKRVNPAQKTVSCLLCENNFKIAIEGQIILDDSYPETVNGWKVYAVELRDSNNKWRKLYMNIKSDEYLLKWFKDSTRLAIKKSREAMDILGDKIMVLEGKRLLREAGIKYLYQLFTPRQLASFVTFSYKVREFAKSTEELIFLSLALSEATKTSCLATKWHPPIGEPVPAAAMKTYWIPEHTVETNPLAHVPGTLRPLARNTIASSIRAQVNADRYIMRNNFTYNDAQVKIVNNDAEHVSFPSKINLAIIDPPYMDSVKSYASLSLIHYAGIKLFDYIVKGKISLPKLEVTEKKEISRKPEEYENKLYKVFNKISNSMNSKSRVVLMYNRLESKDWIPPLKAAKRASLSPTAIYWVPGESPGKLARSKLRGIFLIVMRPSTKKSKLNTVKINKVFKANNLPFIDKQKESQAYRSLLKALNEVYS